MRRYGVIRGPDILGIVLFSLFACGGSGNNAETDDTARQVGDTTTAPTDVADTIVADLIPALADVPGEMETVGYVSCPTSGELSQSQQKEIAGMPCTEDGAECGYSEYCACFFWCDCTDGIWVCDSLCDDSCLEGDGGP